MGRSTAGIGRAHLVVLQHRAPLGDVAILFITLFLTVFADFVIAVNVGVILATLHFLRRMAASVDVRLETDEGINRELFGNRRLALPPGTLVYAIDGPFFFAAVEAFERALARTQTDPRVLIIRLGRVPFLDITGLQALEEVIADLTARGVRVILCEANARIETKLKRAGTLTKFGPAALASDLSEAVGSAALASPEFGEKEPAGLLV